MTAVRTGEAVIGDGTTAGSRARGRWRRWRLGLGCAVLIAAVGLAAAAIRPPTTSTPFAPDSAGGRGAMALANILGSHGVEITYTRRAGQAVAAATPGTTLLVVEGSSLTDEQVAALVATGADVVLVDPAWWLLTAFTEALDITTGSADQTIRPPVCDDEDAVAAEGIVSQGSEIVLRADGPTVCFPAADATMGAYAVVDLPDGRRLTVVGDSSLITNARLAEHGNAALLLRALGRTPDLVWYLPSWDDTSVTDDGAQAGAGILPTWIGPVAAQLVLVVAVAAVWRGRRLGRLVTEPLPVTVRAAETTYGRGRLYRRASARGRATAALRAGAAQRCAARLGVPGNADAAALLQALGRATGRTAEDLSALLYGPPPTDDAGLARLALALDELESEVHRS